MFNNKKNTQKTYLKNEWINIKEKNDSREEIYRAEYSISLLHSAEVKVAKNNTK